MFSPFRAASIAVLMFAIHSSAQPLNVSSPRALTPADYARAEKFMPYNTNPLVYHAVRPAWSAERVWYRDNGPDGARFVLFDPVKLTKEPAFDHAKLAASLATVAATTYPAGKLPLSALEFSADVQSFSFTIGARRFQCDRQCNRCEAEKSVTGRNEVASPDKKRIAFVREENLWARDAATGKEMQLTTDGVKNNSYALHNAGWVKSDRPILLWSPDSKKIATFQQDQRNVGEMYLVETKVGHPVLQAWKYPLPGDETVAMIQRVIVDVETQHVVRLQMPPDQHRSTLCDDVVCRGSDWADVEWSPDSSRLAFVSTSRDHQRETLRIADAATGAVRDVMEEHTTTQYESGQGMVNWRYLPASNEFIWYSERSNWGHLYLYDLATGALKNPITSGEFALTELLRVDEKARALYFLAAGREKGRDPYFAHLYRVGSMARG